ncbi:DNA primase [Geitlerinema sp. FC II]|nr:DNA primase [Geitlerinema sp. FC II]
MSPRLRSDSTLSEVEASEVEASEVEASEVEALKFGFRMRSPAPWRCRGSGETIRFSDRVLHYDYILIHLKVLDFELLYN